MRKPNPNIDKLRLEFHSNYILALADIKQILNTTVNMSVYRILSTLSYLSSYSHAGRYYTLPEIPNFNQNGIWEYSQVYFSQYGTLKDTILQLLTQSKSGYSANELKEIVKIPIQNPLLSLFKNNQIKREQLSGEYIYFSTSKFKWQAKKRRSELINTQTLDYDDYLLQFYSVLNEKQKRWFAGLQSIKLGYGGDKIVARKLDLHVSTVAKGRDELLTSNLDLSRIRAAGAGRPSIKKKSKS